MLVGQNAYFIEVGAPGGHAGIEDTCVTCHMETTPPPDVLSYNQGGTNHTFRADRNICSECHSPNLSPDDVQGGIEHLAHVVEGLLADAYYDLMDDLIDSGKTIDLNGDRLITNAATISEIHFGETRGRQALTVTFTDMAVYGPHRITDIDVLEAGSPTLTLADFADDAVLKSGWNLALVENDGSRGAHNPFFASGVLVAARDALTAFMGGTMRSPGEFRQAQPGAVRKDQKFETVRGLRR
jgi:hypothetical protein